MLELSQAFTQVKQSSDRLDQLYKLLDLETEKKRLSELNERLKDKSVWQDLEKIKTLSQQKTLLEKNIARYETIQTHLLSTQELIELAHSENDSTILDELMKDLNKIEKRIDELEFQQLFSDDMDSHACYVEIQAGSGGTEAQDWAEMLFRQYLRWIERHQFKSEILEISDGEVAGIKSASIKVTSDYAYGWLRTETGVHRLVRKSPFNSGNRRHTSFASVFVSPEVDDSFEIDINPADLRVDVYRASGAGGQHVNRTESAIRLTHLPTNTVTQCQNSRSQHSNKAEALKQLRAKLYKIELKKKNIKKQQLENSKADIGWGNQIRSYILDSGRIKDLRTGKETGNTQAVLDGDLDEFIIASLQNNL